MRILMEIGLTVLESHTHKNGMEAGSNFVFPTLLPEHQSTLVEFEASVDEMVAHLDTN